MSAIFDKYWCDDLIHGNTNIVDITNGVFFPRTFSAYSEIQGFGNGSEKLIQYSRSTIQFSEHSGQMFVQTTSHDHHFSAFVDSKLNVCLLHHESNGHCVKTKQPCEVIAELVGSVKLEEGKVRLKSARESLGWYPRWFQSVVKFDEAKTRGISSVSYVACQNIESSTDTTISQWHFLDTSQIKAKGNKPVLLMVRHQIENDVSAPIKSVQIEYTDFKQMKKDIHMSFLDRVDSDCISNNMKDVNKTIPTPPTTFSYIKETYVARADGDTRGREVEAVYYNYGAAWLHYDAYLTSLNKGEVANKEIRVTEDFITGIRYEISKAGKWCKTFPTLSGASYGNPNSSKKMKTPHEFWNINTASALYLGMTNIRGIPCDAWRIGLPDTDKYEKTRTIFTLFLATGKWLKRLRLPEESFLPIKSIEKSDSNVKYHSYFVFKDQLGYFTPDVSPCYNTNHSAGVRLILLTSFYKSIKNNPLEFERKFRKVVHDVSGIESALQVANIKARPSTEVPQETRVTFKILGRTGIPPSSVGIGSNNRGIVSTSEALTRLQKAVKEQKFEFRYGFHSSNRYIQAKPNSFLLLKEGMCEDHDQDDAEQISSSSFSAGAMAGLCLLAFVVGLMAGFGAMCGCKRKSCKKFTEIAENGKRPSSSASVNRSVFGILNLKTEEANWSWT